MKWLKRLVMTNMFLRMLFYRDIKIGDKFINFLHYDSDPFTDHDSSIHIVEITDIKNGFVEYINPNINADRNSRSMSYFRGIYVPEEAWK